MSRKTSLPPCTPSTSNSNRRFRAWVAILGIALSSLCLHNFTPLIDEAGFTEPSAFTVDVRAFAQEYETAMATASHLSAYATLMYWDSLFAVAKGAAAYALLSLLVEDAAWPRRTVPVHVALDLCENCLTLLVLHAFARTEAVSVLAYCVPLVSTLKWSLAGLNTGAIPVLAVYRAGEWIFSKSKPN